MANWGRILLFLLFLFFPFGQLEKLPLGIGGVSIYLHDLVLILLWVWLLVKKRSWLEDLKRSGIVNRFGIFAVVAFLSWLIALLKWGFGPSLLGLAYLIRFVLLSGVYFVIWVLVDSGEAKAGQVNKLLRGSIFWTAIFGWIQYFFWSDLTHLKYLGWDDHYFRLTGTFLDPNFMGIILVFGLGLEFLRKRPTFFKKLFLLITLAFTYSRSSWLSWLVLLFGWAFYYLFVKNFKGLFSSFANIFSKGLIAGKFALWLMISVIIFFVLPRPAGEGGNLMRTVSTYARFENWQQSWQVIRENPLVGVGFNNYQLASSGNNKADNSFLLVWATAGAIGLIAFLFWVVGLRPLWLIFPIIVHSFFNNSFFYPWVLLLVWAVQGLFKPYFIKEGSVNKNE
ncbi:O-antigen ligase family protein [Patescibacteria group bacterium]|nr:O-antigen ligase family protein [Patescibacteria group bacterium]